MLKLYMCSFILLSLPPYYKSVAPKIYSCMRIVLYSRQFSKRGEVGLRGLYKECTSLSLTVVHCHVQSWSGLPCFTLRQDSKFPRLGGQLYATISFEMGIRCPE